MTVIFTKLPVKVKGFTVCSCEPDGDFYNVFINECISTSEQLDAALHEQGHIELGHFNGGSVVEKESEVRKWLNT